VSRLAFDIDAWFPNFTLFVFVLAPVLLLVLFSMTILERLGKIPPARQPRKEGRNFSEILGLIPVVYITWPLWEIAEYLIGVRDTINDRLWQFHMPVIMELIIVVGVGQVLYYFYATRPVKEVVA